jgi:hypothetical protein
MKKSIILAICFIATVIVAAAPALAIVIDGDPSDWGPSGFLTGNWSLNETWVPNTGVWFIVEDNRNPKYPVTSGDPSLIPYTGVHIKGIGSSYVFYDEPKVLHRDGYLVPEPFGYEKYDLEAMYFQQDDNNVYLLIVTSLAPDGKGELAPGDLRIDINKTKNSGDGYKYELGIKLGRETGLEQFGIYEVSEWTNIADYIPENYPTNIKAGTKVGDATGFYIPYSDGNEGTGHDYGVPIYIIELLIPKSAIGGPGTYYFEDFSLTDACTNDRTQYVPEFPTIAVSIAMIMGIAFTVYRIKHRRS